MREERIRKEHIMSKFNGLDLHLGNISCLSTAKTRSISRENFTGEKGKGGGMTISGTSEECVRDSGQGWNVSPVIRIQPGGTIELANIEGPGAIR